MCCMQTYNSRPRPTNPLKKNVYLLIKNLYKCSFYIVDVIKRRYDRLQIPFYSHNSKWLVIMCKISSITHIY